LWLLEKSYPLRITEATLGKIAEVKKPVAMALLSGNTFVTVAFLYSNSSGERKLS
jgi:hypothetical protein